MDMKYLKMLGLAAFAAMALMAFGAGSASATKLCTDSACTTVYPAGTEIHSSLVAGTTARLTSGSTTVDTCTASTIKGKTSNESGATVSGNIETLSWGETNTACSVTTDTVKNGKLEIKWTSGTSGEVIGKESEVTTNTFGTSCTFGTGTGTVLGTITGGTAPKITISTTVQKTAGNFLCPNSAGWDAEYVVTSPHALFVGS
jgi:hypothetical protein